MSPTYFEHVHCSRCGTQCSYVECPECLAKDTETKVLCPDCDHGVRGGAPCESCHGAGYITVWERIAWADARADRLQAENTRLKQALETARRQRDKAESAVLGGGTDAT